jgi:hypothetical protein
MTLIRLSQWPTLWQVFTGERGSRHLLLISLVAFNQQLTGLNTPVNTGFEE